jgi:hypothetical protein
LADATLADAPAAGGVAERPSAKLYEAKNATTIRPTTTRYLVELADVAADFAVFFGEDVAGDPAVFFSEDVAAGLAVFFGADATAGLAVFFGEGL